MDDAKTLIPFVKKQGLMVWFARQAAGRGMAVALSVTNARPAEARINHGRWLADCGLLDDGLPCLGAELVTQDEPVMLCLSCGNAELGGAFRRVKFPKEAAEIEGLLEGRPVPNRNWDTQETVAVLRQQNREHGVR